LNPAANGQVNPSAALIRFHGAISYRACPDPATPRGDGAIGAMF
jgi:hypothetical protein